MLKNIYNQRITILNKIRGEDSDSHHDEWYKYTVDDACWYFQSERNLTGSIVTIGAFVKVYIPFHPEYLQYKQWKQLDSRDDNFTLSIGDYIVLGDVEEEVTSQNVVSVINKYRPNACQVKIVNPLYKRFGAKIQLYVEGV